ncbi:MAG: hypothetical protein K2G32_02300 [Oscillospiraceae bacterium]|nr:hypothetical protein [Oscillospiraceae bacterium]
MFGLLENAEKLNDLENELGKFTVEYFCNFPDQPAYAYFGFADQCGLPKEHVVEKLRGSD